MRCPEGSNVSHRLRTVRTMQRTSNQLTALESLFLEAGLPATEVDACPAPDCSLCRRTLPKAA